MGYEITRSDQGDFDKTFKFLKSLQRHEHFKVLDELGRRGVDALRSATPRDSGLTAECWDYNIIDDGDHVYIEWTNSNMGNGWFPIAIMLQYGHGTRTGGYVQGRDYINPAIKPVFDDIVDAVRKVMNSL